MPVGPHEAAECENKVNPLIDTHAKQLIHMIDQSLLCGGGVQESEHSGREIMLNYQVVGCSRADFNTLCYQVKKPYEDAGWNDASLVVDYPNIEAIILFEQSIY